MDRPRPWSPPTPLPLPLSGARVVVDGWREEDAEALFSAISAHRTALAEWLPWARTDHEHQEDTLDRIRVWGHARTQSDADDFGLGIFATGTREVLGGTGFHRIDADRQTAEVGYWIRPDRQGEGLATEAVGLLITSGFRDWGFRRIVVTCDKANLPSHALARKLGLRQEAERREVSPSTAPGQGWATELEYACLAHEWDEETQQGLHVPDERLPLASKGFAARDPRIAPYVYDLVRPEDPALTEIRARSLASGLPDIAVGPMDGRHLEVITAASGAKKAVEIGTLGGYSTVCLARGLASGGVLHTFELDPRHAEVAAESVRRAGYEDVVRVHVGSALERLADITAEAPFDLVFIDADKERYPAYLAWAENHLRVGGVLLADNVFRKPRRAEMAEVIDAFNRLLAGSPRWRTTMLPLEDGLAFAVKVA